MEQTILTHNEIVMEEHNLVTYKTPLNIVPTTIGELMLDPGEKALAENAIWWFLDGTHWEPRDKARLAFQWKSKGWNMFSWKYYRVARCYLGGYKALSATLMLRKV